METHRIDDQEIKGDELIKRIRDFLQSYKAFLQEYKMDTIVLTYLEQECNKLSPDSPLDSFNSLTFMIKDSIERTKGQIRNKIDQRQVDPTALHNTFADLLIKSFDIEKLNEGYQKQQKGKKADERDDLLNYLTKVKEIVDNVTFWKDKADLGVITKVITKTPPGIKDLRSVLKGFSPNASLEDCQTLRGKLEGIAAKKILEAQREKKHHLFTGARHEITTLLYQTLNSKGTNISGLNNVLDKIKESQTVSQKQVTSPPFERKL